MTYAVEGSGISNSEGLHEYDVTWPWVDAELSPGMTTVLRVKNEARTLPHVLPGLFETTDAVVLVDNGSEDGTAEVARRVADEVGSTDRLEVHDYPFDVSRCGPEHLHTPERSVHSLAYFYNWAFAHVRTTYSMKWDGDMVPTREGVATLADLSWQLRDDRTVVRIPRHPLFVEPDASVAYLDLGIRNAEKYIYPVGPAYTFVKAFEWELQMHPDDIAEVLLPEGLCVEVKWLDADEFSHWSGPDAFATSSRTARKRREYDIFHALASGSGAELEGLVRIEAPAGRNVIEYVTDDWLPRQRRPLIQA